MSLDFTPTVAQHDLDRRTHEFADEVIRAVAADYDERQAATPEQMLQWAPECFGTPADVKLAALAISQPEVGSDVRNLRAAGNEGSAAAEEEMTPNTADKCGTSGHAYVRVATLPTSRVDESELLDRWI